MSFNTRWLRFNEIWIRNTREYKKIRNEQETIKNSGGGEINTCVERQMTSQICCQQTCLTKNTKRRVQVESK